MINGRKENRMNSKKILDGLDLALTIDVSWNKNTAVKRWSPILPSLTKMGIDNMGDFHDYVQGVRTVLIAMYNEIQKGEPNER